MSSTITKYFHNLQQIRETISTKTNNHIPLNENKQGFKKWKESTTVSPSERYLCHHHILLSSDSNQHNEDQEDFSDRMWNLHHIIISIALLNEKPLNRWLT